MSSYRTVVTFFRRRQKFVILLLFAVILYGLIQSFGDVHNSVRVKLDSVEKNINPLKLHRLADEKVQEISSHLKNIYYKQQNWLRFVHENDILKALTKMTDNPPILSATTAKLLEPFVQSNDFGQCTQTYPKEAAVDFNTFDIYKKKVAAKTNDDVPTRKKHGPKKLKVFFLPMTHLDPGWLRTFESYTKDTNSILNNLHSFLTTHDKMRFMWCEIIFFEHWWKGVNETVKNDIRRLIANGQLEIASASWVMTDEANPYYPVTVDNIIEGQQFVFHELNTTASTIWSNDPFGYGPTVPYLFRKAGLKNAVINRVHHAMKQYLQSKKAIPYLWRQHFDPTGDNDILTQILPYSHYDILNSCGPNGGICCQFDFKRMTHFSCYGEKPVPITKGNVVQKAALLEQQLLLMSELYESNVLLVMWGDDFRYDMYQEWHQHYDNLMPLFEQINSGNKTEVRFGTFADYFGELNSYYLNEKTQPSTISGDFFPYKCSLGDLWTGYYTTRPFFKKLGRKLHAMIYAADVATLKAHSIMSLEEKQQARINLTFARRNLALFQHHDAITGTSKKHVMKNYAELLFESLRKATSTFSHAINRITGLSYDVDGIPLQYDQLPTNALLRFNAGEKVSIAVWNSLPRIRKSCITLRVSTPNVIVKDGDEEVLAQVEPFFDDVTANFTADFQLTFMVNLSPLTTSVYTVEYSEMPKTTIVAELFLVSQPNNKLVGPKLSFSKEFVVQEIPPHKLLISTQRMKTTHNPETGLLATMETESTTRISITQTIDQYADSGGGAYIMRAGRDATPLQMKQLQRFLVKGPVRHVVHVHSEMFRQKISALVTDDVEGDMLNIDMRVDIRQLRYVQLVTRFVTSLDAVSSSAFTDSNGFQLIKRESHTSLQTEANYYPMPTSFVLQDKDKRVSIISDLEHGAMALGKNGAEIMLDRILLTDDGKGLGNGEDSIPNDMLPVNIGFTIMIEERTETAELPQHFAYHSPMAHYVLQSRIYQPVVLTSNESKKQEENEKLLEFPCDIQLVSVRSLPDDINKRLIVLHRLGTDCSPLTKVSCTTASLKDALIRFLKSSNVSTVERTNLSGIKRSENENNVEDLSVEIQPMDFASLIVHIK